VERVGETTDAEEYEKVENRVDDSRFVKKVGQERTRHGHGPQQPEPSVEKFAADAVHKQQRKNPAQCVYQSRAELVYAESLHGQCLQPKKQRWFFPKRLVIDLHLQVIARYYHFTGRLGEIDFVPIKEMNAAQKRDKERRADDKNKELVTYFDIHDYC
jgi:hypothetical protein